MQQIKKDYNTIYLENIINDLVLALNFHINGYPLDDNHISKQKELIIRAYRVLGTPITTEEMIVCLAWHGVF